MTRAPGKLRIAALVATGLAMGATGAHAMIPASERAALLSFYASTNAADVLGGGSGDWIGAPGTECTWYGVKCDAGETTVTKITLPGLHLTGKLPSNLNKLVNLGVFDVSGNELTGSIPPLAGMTSMVHFDAGNNLLTGSIPSLNGLKSLNAFFASNNQLTGTIPPLSGLANLTDFNVQANQLSGAIPPVAGLAKLISFNVNANQLSGTIPPLTDLPKLFSFRAPNNQLTGSIPALNDAPNLVEFEVSNNRLTGSIPSLSGMTSLLNFEAGFNQLTGSIPALSGTPNLIYFGVSNNLLDGALPPLAGLAHLYSFDASFNKLTGAIPSLAGLTILEGLHVENNQLTGDVPAVASPNRLTPGFSKLCPNDLNHSTDPAWDAATGQTPWYANCVALAPNANLQGLWWNAAQSGWGINLTHQGDQIYATWYTYDTSGNAFWLSMLAMRTSPTANDYRGDIYADVGPPFNDFAGSGTASRVGNGTLTFSDVNTGSFAYNVSAGGASYVQQAEPITRFVLDAASAQPVCTFANAPNLAAATNYQDLWWVPTESGWGVNFAHQGDQIFATWYTYDANAPGSGNPPLWMSALMKREGTSNVFSGTLTRTAGQRFDAVGPGFTAQNVGTVSTTFDDGNHATFAYVTTGSGSVPAANQSKTITRFLFAAPAGTTCQ